MTLSISLLFTAALTVTLPPLTLSLNYNAPNKNQYSFSTFSLPHEVVAWGYDQYGGVTNGRTDEVLNGGVVNEVFSTERAFALLMSDNTVVCYGLLSYGGDCHRSDSGHGVSSDMTSGKVVTIAATRSAFAAVTTEGKIVTWGVSDEGGKCVNVVGVLSTLLHSPS